MVRHAAILSVAALVATSVPSFANNRVRADSHQFLPDHTHVHKNVNKAVDAIPIPRPRPDNLSHDVAQDGQKETQAVDR